MMKKYLIFIFGLILFVGGCEEKIKILEKSQVEEINQLTYEIGDNKVLFTGKVIEKYENGQISYEKTYKDGKRNGVGKAYHENGQLSEEKFYKDGKQEGIWKKYDSEGKLIFEENYKIK